MDFDKIYGATERHDGLYNIGRNKYEARYGYGKDGDNGYDYRKVYHYKPSIEELKEEITALVNRQVDERILSGYTFAGKPVWLSSENQFNYKAVYDLACKDSGILPMRFKLGEDAEGNVVYHTFKTLEELGEFYMGAIQWINQCVQEGWKEKDGIDLSKYACED